MRFEHMASTRGTWSFSATGPNQKASSVSSLGRGYYATSCPNVESIVRSTMRGLFVRDPTSPAAMIRLLFHDCQVFGCDASILLDSGDDGTAEVEASANLGVRRLDFIDNVKRRLEAACPQTVSCADIIAIAARDAVALNGGPDIAIPLGRLDGFRASSSVAQSSLPSASISVSGMLSLFGSMGMNLPESVAILGAHTLGVAHCTNFVDRLYPTRDPNMGLLFANSLKARCPRRFPSNAFAALDTSNLRFDNSYFRNVLNRRGLLTIDSELGLDPRTGPIVQNYAANPSAFFSNFASAFVKLSSFNVLSGNQGEVRGDCRSSN
ncbi:hypothetical protein GOP47_0012346 [Adiantum capillus-veneris]|uniref:Peroxidase n=1 Tax=Adiantum capillus-veneris TaxID=13818 RepID=A0A9D4UQH9_ADICA|nr:hypothetical protein GOP47_0012346 [Adiantum capillus-veneris]